MTPEETKQMAERIAKNRQEENKAKVAPRVKAAKVAKAPKANVKKGIAPAKPIGPAMKLFKFKDGPKSREVCDVLNCREVPKTGFRCTKHKKLIRKAQLKANNVVWKKRVKAGTAGHHVIYTRKGEKKPIATKFTLKNTDKAIKVVKDEHSIVTEVGVMKEIIARTKKEKAA